MTTEEVLLAGVPRVGDSIRLQGTKPNKTLVVLHVLWLTSSPQDPGPQVIVEVRIRDEG